MSKYKERIKTIYIDPPYNTGNDGFVYKDNYNHSSWLSMMENRLFLAKELMREDGVIFSSIDDNEVDNLKKLEDIIFGIYIKNIIWESGKPFGFKATKTVWPRIHEYILHYGKSEKFDYLPTYTEKKSSSGEKILTGSIIKVDTDKIYSTDFIQGAKQGISSYGLSGFGSGQKPYKLIQKLISASNNNNSIILDFFAGSGTTADAVIRLNLEDQGNRKFILTELNDYFDNIIIPRIKKVSFWTEWENGKPDFSDKNGKQSGIFFKYLYLDQYEDILEEKIDDYINKFFETQGEEEKQVEKGFYDDFREYLENYSLNNLTKYDYLQTLIYHNGLKEKKYIYLDGVVILQTNNGNYVKILDEKQGYENLINYIKNNQDNYYLPEKDYKELLKQDKSIKNYVFKL